MIDQEEQAGSGEPLLSARAVRKAFDTPGGASQEILRGIDLDFRRGEFAGIVGPSGSGKSTLLYILGALDAPTSGAVTIAGTRLAGLSQRRLAGFRNRVIGFVFQFHFLLPEFTALENVLMPALIGGAGRRDVEPRARELLERVGMTHRAGHRSTRLSGGEAQRVAIARSLINRPELVLCDEPTGNLDTSNSEIVYQLLREINRDQQVTVLVVTHDRGFAERTDRVVRLVDGRVESDCATDFQAGGFRYT